VQGAGGVQVKVVPDAGKAVFRLLTAFVFAVPAVVFESQAEFAVKLLLL
jgi:hypothetical protein